MGSFTRWIIEELKKIDELHQRTANLEQDIIDYNENDFIILRKSVGLEIEMLIKLSVFDDHPRMTEFKNLLNKAHLSRIEQNHLFLKHIDNVIKNILLKYNPYSGLIYLQNLYSAGRINLKDAHIKFPTLAQINTDIIKTKSDLFYITYISTFREWLEQYIQPDTDYQEYEKLLKSYEQGLPAEYIEEMHSIISNKLTNKKIKMPTSTLSQEVLQTLLENTNN